MNNNSYGILITTRNRVDQLYEVIKSISELEHKPNLVVISYSGENPRKEIEVFQELLKIQWVENNKPGQVLQKKNGLKMFGNEVEWIMFCDDDLILTPFSVSYIFEAINNHDLSFDIAGAGFALESKSKKRITGIENLIRSVFGVGGKPPGSVKFNGYNTNYIQENSVLQTMWLNGASIWRREIAKGYDVRLEDVSHALGEDLIFSYGVSRKHVLIYVPNSVIYFQSGYATKLNTIQERYERLYHNLYFVLLYAELSRYGYLWRTFGTIITSITLSYRGRILMADLYNFVDLIWLIGSRKSADYVLEKRIKNF
jgi:uncharacterized protein (DUF486 family)